MKSSAMKNIFLFVGVAMTGLLWQLVEGHGRLYTPGARGTLWRKGFSTPVNYNDNEMFCGGFAHQLSLGYKCGICGDPWDSDRPHEAGGRYATGTIAQTYYQAQEALLQVDLTANHRGWFEFKICPTNNPNVRANQTCLDRYPLQLSDGSGTKLYVGDFSNNMISIPVWLPAGLHCDQCVLQWHYHTGNSWGKDENGRGCLGCGPQEEFYGCADIRILPRNESPGPTAAPITFIPTRQTTTTTTTTTTPRVPVTFIPQTAAPGPVRPSGGNRGRVPTMLSCTALRPNLGNWCDINCNQGFCPATHCQCQRVQDPRVTSNDLSPGCYATSPFVIMPGMDDWCSANCAMGHCPTDRCFCKTA